MASTASCGRWAIAIIVLSFGSDRADGAGRLLGIQYDGRAPPAILREFAETKGSEKRIGLHGEVLKERIRRRLDGAVPNTSFRYFNNVPSTGGNDPHRTYIVAALHAWETNNIPALVRSHRQSAQTPAASWFNPWHLIAATGKMMNADRYPGGAPKDPCWLTFRRDVHQTFLQIPVRYIVAIGEMGRDDRWGHAEHFIDEIAAHQYREDPRAAMALLNRRRSLPNTMRRLASGEDKSEDALEHLLERANLNPKRLQLGDWTVAFRRAVRTLKGTRTQGDRATLASLQRQFAKPGKLKSRYRRAAAELLAAME